MSDNPRRNWVTEWFGAWTFEIANLVQVLAPLFISCLDFTKLLILFHRIIVQTKGGNMKFI